VAISVLPFIFLTFCILGLYTLHTLFFTTQKDVVFGSKISKTIVMNIINLSNNPRFDVQSCEINKSVLSHSRIETVFDKFEFTKKSLSWC